MPRYKIVIEYLGTNYAGWQQQPSNKTIQGEIQEALLKFCAESIKIFASGRTDAGVHALGQVAHFDLSQELKPTDILQGLNFYLKSSDIAILEVHLATPEFDARFSAIRRHYMYKIINRPAPSAIYRHSALHIARNLQIIKMQQAAQHFIGQHDFSAFQASQCMAKSSIRTIYQLSLDKQDQIIQIRICANSFLHHMVRNIVGTLLIVGDAKITPESISKIIASKSRSMAGPKAPAHGLYLTKVDY